MKTVKQVSKLTGISVRTLHHYDAIGLLKPTKVTEAGYRLYDDMALKRLQNILLFRELQFPLKEIKSILDSPDFDPSEAIEQQIKLLELQKNQIEKLISFAREIQQKGVNKMDFNVFDKTEIEQYLAEVRIKWGSTKAYEEYEQKNRDKSDSELAETASRLMSVFVDIGSLKHLSPADEKVQQKIGALQTFITNHYYNCTDDMLKGLGQMYINDERFKHNIDKAGGEGTAQFIRQAILVYCS
ncbi:MAG: MerR family transcriptional regulator [Ruminococcus sp.]|nr:MerR family transcriptional regulator [Ruminococcus sp.]